jgi:hypothetical protein
MSVFSTNIATFYKKEHYCHGYTESVVKPTMNHLTRGTTVAPVPIKKKGPMETKRHPSRNEGTKGGFTNSRALPRTVKNMELYDIEAQLQRDMYNGGKELRVERATTVARMLLSAWGRICEN